MKPDNNNPCIFNEENVDLTVTPKKRDGVDDKTIFAIGDLHANPMKLLHFLVTEGMLNPFNDTDWKELWSAYNGKELDLSASIKKFFNVITQHGKIGDNIESKPYLKLYLIGDDTADRGNNDVFPIGIVVWLKEVLKIDVHIIESNHGIESTVQYLDSEIEYPALSFNCAKSNYKYNSFKKDSPDFKLTLGTQHFTCSELETIYFQSKQLLALLAPADTVNELPWMSGYLLTHALTDRITVASLYAHFFPKEELSKKVQTFQKKNTIRPQEAVFNNQTACMSTCIMNSSAGSAITPLLWNSAQDRKVKGLSSYFGAAFRRSKLNSLARNTIHGHDGDQTLQGNFSIDRNLGKCSSKGTYTAFSGNKTLISQQTCVSKKDGPFTQRSYARRLPLQLSGIALLALSVIIGGLLLTNPFGWFIGATAGIAAAITATGAFVLGAGSISGLLMFGIPAIAQCKEKNPLESAFTLKEFETMVHSINDLYRKAINPHQLGVTANTSLTIGDSYDLDDQSSQETATKMESHPNKTLPK